MTQLQQVGFRLLFWLASRMVDSALTPEQRRELQNIATAAPLHWIGRAGFAGAPVRLLRRPRSARGDRAGATIWPQELDHAIYAVPDTKG